MSRSAGRLQLVDREARVVSLLRILIPRDLRSRYRRSLFDVLWAVISPVVVVIVYGVILVKAFGVQAECGVPYLSMAWLGLVVWTFFATALGSAVYSLISASDLVTKVYFPREALPLATVGASLLDLAAGLLIAIPLLWIQGVRPTVTVLGAIPALLVVVLWAAVLSAAASTVAVFARDVTHVVQLALRVGFFATPVMYEASALPPAFRWSVAVNPVAVSIDALRASVLCHRWPDFGLVGAHLVTGVIAFVLVVLYVRRVESRIADVV